ncbi:MAG: hypothetical protein ACI8PZ_000919 [Myxococcota bacterium]|jgi:hypothetical protein
MAPRLVIGGLIALALVLAMACGGEGKDGVDSAQPAATVPGAGSGGSGGNNGTTDGHTAWDNQAPCPEGPLDDVPLQTQCEPLIGATWCWTVTDASLVAFAVGSGLTDTCTTPLSRAVDARDMTELAGIVYACERKGLVRIDPRTGEVEDLDRACWGLASFDEGLLLNEGPDIRYYPDEAALRGDSSGLRLGETWGEFIDTRGGMLYTLPADSTEWERSCTEDGTLRAEMPLIGFEGGIHGVSVLPPERMFVLDDDGAVRQYEAKSGTATGIRATAPAGATGLVCGAL